MIAVGALSLSHLARSGLLYLCHHVVEYFGIGRDCPWILLKRKLAAWSQ